MEVAGREDVEAGTVTLKLQERMIIEVATQMLPFPYTSAYLSSCLYSLNTPIE